jgi:hypothetical protein
VTKRLSQLSKIIKPPEELKSSVSGVLEPEKKFQSPEHLQKVVQRGLPLSELGFLEAVTLIVLAMPIYTR